MPSSLRDPADVVNATLIRIGWRQQIANLYDGSAAAELALGLYGQVRDDLLRASDWDFAQRSVTMTLLKSAPAGGYIPPTTWDPTNYPPLNWLYEYTFPADCLKVRAVKPTPIFVPEFDPQPHTFSIANDNAYTPARRVILTNLENAVLIYTGRVTNPSTWAVDFAEGFIDRLGEVLAPALTGLDTAKLAAVEGRDQINQATMEQG